MRTDFLLFFCFWFVLNACSSIQMCKLNRVVSSNFGHPAPTSSLTKYELLQKKNNFAIIVNELSVFKLFQLSNVDLLFS